jgi:hypothetical protein
MKSFYSVLSISLLGSLLWLSSCNTCETSVAQFQNDDTTWTVYQPNDSLLMVDHTDTVRVFLHTRLNSDLIPGDGFGPADACIEQYYTRRTSIMQHNARRFPALTVMAIRTPDTMRVSLIVAQRAELLIPDLNNTLPEPQTIGGQTYQNVYEVLNPESGPNGVSRILFNRDFGFLRIEYADGRSLTRVSP